MRAFILIALASGAALAPFHLAIGACVTVAVYLTLAGMAAQAERTRHERRRLQDRISRL